MRRIREKGVGLTHRVLITIRSWGRSVFGSVISGVDIFRTLRAVLPGSATARRIFFSLRCRRTLKLVLYSSALLLVFACSQLFRDEAQSAAKTNASPTKSPAAKVAEPAVYGDYPDRQQFSPLSQVNRTNVKNLHVAWTYDLGQSGAQFEATPIVVGNMMYFPTPDSKVVALDAMTGKEVWKFAPDLKFTRVCRGVAYWPGGPHSSPRILFGTADGKLIALDPKTGKLLPDFGDAGYVDVRKMATQGFPETRMGYTSPPAILRDKVILSPYTQEAPSKGPTGNGDPRAFDVNTGEQLWQFHSMPRPGEPGADTWGPQGTVDRSGPSAWVPNAVDRKRNMVFVITGNPAGVTPYGKNLYSACILALDGTTGKLIWYFQTVHHDIWDDDGIDSAVIEVHRGNTIVPAVVALNKSGALFILDEMTGKPLFDVNEVPVPQVKSDEPEETSWPTQPVAVAPPPFTRSSISDNELANLSPDSAKYCRDLLGASRHDGSYTPFGSTPTVNFPSAIGGPNWDSVSFSPQVGYMFISSSEMGSPTAPPSSALRPATRPTGQPQAGQAPRRGGGPTRFVDPNGYPCQVPPWGSLTAINPSTGKIVWRVPLGDYGNIQEGKSNAQVLTSLPDGPGRDVVQKACSTSCHGIGEVLGSRQSKGGWSSKVEGMAVNATPADKATMVDYLAKYLPPLETGTEGAAQAQTSSSAPASAHEPTGTPNLGGSMVTAGNLVFIGATLDNKFRAFDALTGKELWSYQLDGIGQATPMSFLGSDGKQYVVIASGGPGLLGGVHNTASNSPDKIVVFSLQK